jgi:hypothetical protein
MKQNKIYVKTDFIMILGIIITDTRVSATAVRIYCYLASKVGCWSFYNNDIKEALGIKSDHSISKYLRELIDCGYLGRKELRNNGAFAGYQYILSTVCQKMTIGVETEQNKNDLIFQQKYRMSKNDNRQSKEKEKCTKEKELFNNINNKNNILKEKINKKEKLPSEKPQKPSEKKAATFEIKNEVDKEFFRYLQYRKKDLKKSYKSEQTLSVAYNRFLELCNGDADVAKQIVDNTIANVWTGLFAIKQKGGGRFVANSNSSAYENIGVKA